MAAVNNAQQAINIVDNFIARYHWYKKLLSCNRAEKEWVLVYDVGSLVNEFVQVRVDPANGEILEYTNHGAKKP